MAKFVHHIDLNENEIKKGKFEVHGSDPSTGQFDGWTIYHSGHKTIKVYAGGGTTAWRSLLYDATSSTTALTITNNANGTLSFVIANAIASGAAGLMTGADKAKLDAATSADSTSTIVARDGSGNFTGNTITAASGFSGNLTGDVQGNVTGNVTGQVSDISNHDTGDLAEGTNLYYTDARVRANRLDQMAAPTATVDFNSQIITGVATPVGDTDAANKAYVDAARTGLDVKASVRAATTPAGGNITLSGTQTVDGVALIAGDRILVKDQTDAAENGIYVVDSGSWSRSEDADNSPSGEVTGGMFTFVEEGTLNADSGWVLTTNGAPALGTDDLDFALFSVAGNILAGEGLSKTGDVLAVNVDDSTIEINTDTLRVKAAGITETHLNTSVAGNGLSGGAGSALDINILATGGLQITTDDLGIKLDTNSALALSANGLTVDSGIAGTGLTWTNGVLSVDAIDLASGSGGGVTGILPVANGGTNASTAADARANLDVPRKYVAYVPSGSTSATITHNLGTSDTVVQVYEVSTGETVFTDVERKDSGGTLSDNDVTLTFSVAPSSNQYRVVIIAVE